MFISIFKYSRYGPLVRHWTMRFEAEHSYFKQLAHRMGNYINLPYSLSLRHQEYQCYLNATANGLHGSNVDLTVGPGNSKILNQMCYYFNRFTGFP